MCIQKFYLERFQENFDSLLGSNQLGRWWFSLRGVLSVISSTVPCNGLRFASKFPTGKPCNAESMGNHRIGRSQTFKCRIGLIHCKSITSASFIRLSNLTQMTQIIEYKCTLDSKIYLTRWLTSLVEWIFTSPIVSTLPKLPINLIINSSYDLSCDQNQGWHISISRYLNIDHYMLELAEPIYLYLYR